MQNDLFNCPYCHASGLISITSDKRATICMGCKGSGSSSYGTIIFNGRKKLDNVEKIRGAYGTPFYDPRNNTWLTYAEFQQKIPDKK